MNTSNKPVCALLWIAAYMILIDIAINVAFPYPKDPHNISPSAIAQFFEYGRSIEGKLTRMTGKTDASSAPIISAGWLQDAQIKPTSNLQVRPNTTVVTVYGMSHAVLLAQDLATIDKSLSVRIFGAPGAVPTWSYASYLFDRKQQHSDVVVLGIMTLGVPLICTTSGATNHFESVEPYTYPRFFFSNGMLRSALPPFISIDQYRDTFYNPDKWNSYVKWLKQYDKYYDPLLFHKTFLDSSSLLRMLRRAYAHTSQRSKMAEVYEDRNGFNGNSEEVQILLTVIRKFSEDARQNNSLPIIYIVNNVFLSDHLFTILRPTLFADKILFLSTHDICPPNDPRNYLPDSHFIPSKNMELARAMAKIIMENNHNRSVRSQLVR